MARYTTTQYLNKLDKSFAKMLNPKPHFEIVNEVIRRQSVRIFDKSVQGSGSKSPSYDTKPIYVSVKSSPRKTATRGKNSNKRTFKNGKQRKSTYFPGGYAEFKKTIGKGGGGNVNLWLYGNFKAAFLNSGKNAFKLITGDKISIKALISASANNPQGKLDHIFSEYAAFFNLTRGEKGYIVKRNQSLLYEAFK